MFGQEVLCPAATDYADVMDVKKNVLRRKLTYFSSNVGLKDNPRCISKADTLMSSFPILT